ncbi:MAG: hypothetical protein FWD31_10000, partial [Planctomycetaceae bacterium]|nr:hypothetical protein [Planctomycetaceae bacterium]
DFGIPFRETDNPMAIMLPEIQFMRELARALKVKIMLEIHEKRYDDALQSIRVGLSMARHTGKQPCLVCGLVGIAIQSIMLDQVQDMIHAPECPNIYWEVSSLPYPFLNFVDAAEIEKQFLAQSFPLLRKAMTDPDSLFDDEWQRMIRQINELLDNLEYDNESSLFKLLPIKSQVFASYPTARQWLISRGKTAAEIDAMIPEKVVGLHTAQDIRWLTEEYFKIMYLPLWEQSDTQDVVHRYLGDEISKIGINVISGRLVSMLLPAIQSARSAYQRMQFSIDIMRIAEALSDYAARNGGQLPESLGTVKQVPVPMIDPSTGREYNYKLIDGKGRIETNIIPSCIVLFEIVTSTTTGEQHNEN